ncbi:MAG: hypothetical protein GTO41_05930, partial [Burkholderiales bacterium]|nr:hypothetical protein [Burkholderiales bacterium]
SRTDDNGKLYKVRGLADHGSFLVDNGVNQERVSGCVRSFAYWSPEVLNNVDHLLNAQTGEYVSVQLEFVGSEPLSVRGDVIATERYRLSGDKLSIDLWYAGDREWVALQSTTDSGKRLTYQIQ